MVQTRSKTKAERDTAKSYSKIPDREEKLQTGKEDMVRLLPQTPTKPKDARRVESSTAPYSRVAVSPAGSNTSCDSVDDYPWDTPDQRSTWDDAGGGTPLTPPTSGRHNGKKNYASFGSPMPRLPIIHSKLAGDDRKKEEPEVDDEEDDENDEGDDEDDEEYDEAGRSATLSPSAFKDKLKAESTNIKKEIDAGLSIESSSQNVSTIKSEAHEDYFDTKVPINDILAQNIPYGVPGQSILSYIIPFDAQQRYQDDPSICVAFKVKSPHNRCKQRRASRGGPLKNVFKSLLDCYKHHQAMDYDKILSIIRVFVGKALCSNHGRTAELGTRMGALEKYFKMLPDPSLAFTVTEFESWILALSTPAKPNSEATSMKSSAIPEDPFHDHTLPPKPFGRTDSLQVVSEGPGQPKCFINMTAEKAILRVMWRELGEKSIPDGFIYTLSHHSAPSFRKIGYAKDTEKRLAEWDRNCGRHHSIVSLGFVQHAYRVEKLIHAELKDLQKSVKCTKCKKNHKEWFDVRDEHVEKVFQKWQKWISELPYQKGPGNSWRLSSKMVATLGEDCKPVKFEAIGMPNIKEEPCT